MTQRPDRMLKVPLQVGGDQATALYPVPALAPHRQRPSRRGPARASARRSAGRATRPPAAGSSRTPCRPRRPRTPPAACRPCRTGRTPGARARSPRGRASGAGTSRGQAAVPAPRSPPPGPRRRSPVAGSPGRDCGGWPIVDRRSRGIAGSRLAGDPGGRGSTPASASSTSALIVVIGLVRLQRLAERAEAADEQQELADRGFLLDRRQPLGGLEHRGAGGVPGVVGGQRRAVGPDHLGLRDHVERSPGVDEDVHVRERLKARAEPGLGPPHALGDRPDPAVLPGEQGNDAVRFA